MDEKILNERDFSTISPSAKMLLQMKGHTAIPFARQMAELINYPDQYKPDFSKRDLIFWARVLHFEIRYSGINQLLDDLPIQNILELSSGFSFRGLEMVKQKDINYIDTDLEGIIADKNKLISELDDNSMPAKGKLELQPLNALDKEAFRNLVNKFPPGEIAIVNEGLLMYLTKEEKIKLCSIIREILKERGGFWITGDIYLKSNHKFVTDADPKSKEFFEKHNLEENKFESFEQAKEFFKQMGFALEKEADINHRKLSSFKYLVKSMTFRQFFKLHKAGKIHKTWRLRVQ